MIRRYFFAWFGLMIVAILSGGFRDTVFEPHLSDLAAHQLSTVILLILIAGYLWFLTRKWPIGSAKEAWGIGGIWFVMTEVFEIGMGRLLLGQSWDQLFSTYDVSSGHLWVFIPIWVLFSPYIFYQFVQTKPATS